MLPVRCEYFLRLGHLPSLNLTRSFVKLRAISKIKLTAETRVRREHRTSSLLSISLKLT